MHILRTYDLIDAYKIPENTEGWLKCPNCGLRPKVWGFDNGMSTGCGCGPDRYNHFSIYSESIMSVVKRCDGSCMEYDNDDLRKAWNHWALTGYIFFEHAELRNDGRW